MKTVVGSNGRYLRANTLDFAIGCIDGGRQRRRTDFNNGRHRWGCHGSNGSSRLRRAYHFKECFQSHDFAFPNTNADSGRFGQITHTVSQPTTIYGSGLGTAASPRVIELQAKFVF
jgi:hypothetical protein